MQVQKGPTFATSGCQGWQPQVPARLAWLGIRWHQLHQIPPSLCRRLGPGGQGPHQESHWEMLVVPLHLSIPHRWEAVVKSTVVDVFATNTFLPFCTRLVLQWQVSWSAAAASESCSSFTWESKVPGWEFTARTPRSKVELDHALLCIPFIFTWQPLIFEPNLCRQWKPEIPMSKHTPERLPVPIPSSNLGFMLTTNWKNQSAPNLFKNDSWMHWISLGARNEGYNERFRSVGEVSKMLSPK